MAQHDHLLPFLALILLFHILPSSSSRVPESPALFSDRGQFLSGGRNLSFDGATLALFPNCSLHLYKGDSDIDFKTDVAEALDCTLTFNSFGQLVLRSGDEPPTTQTICPAGERSDSYALLFIDGKVGIYGPSIWNNNVSVPSSALIRSGKLRAGVSNNFLISPKRSMGSTNGNTTIAVNGDASAIITNYCQLVTKNETGETFQSHPPTDEPTECFLSVSSTGALLLQYHKGSELYTQWTGGDYAGYNTYVAVLRYFGRIGVYGLKNYLSDCAPVDENIKMVTA